MASEPAKRINSMLDSSNKPDTVPNAKHPKSRAPVGMREKILRTPLPFYSGPYR